VEAGGPLPSVLIKSVISVLLFALVLCFQNCSGAFDVEGGSQSSIDGSFQLGNWNDAFPAGVKTSNCLDDPTYNICLSYKNPIVANKGLSFSPPLTPATSTRATEVIIFNYGLVVPLTGTLRNQHFAISDPVKPTANGTTGWKLAYKDDNNHFMPQLQAFYWANRQLTYMKERTGTFYYSNRIAPIKAFDPGANDNAYFDGIGVSLGYRVAKVTSMWDSMLLCLPTRWDMETSMWPVAVPESMDVQPVDVFAPQRTVALEPFMRGREMCMLLFFFPIVL
jgi:hypothetical protein